jgi:hypothetical protein
MTGDSRLFVANDIKGVPMSRDGRPLPKSNFYTFCLKAYLTFSQRISKLRDS